MSAQPAVEPRALGEVERAIDEFFVARTSKKDSQNTLDAYARDLRSVLDQLARGQRIARSEVTLAHIRDLKTMRRAFAAWSKPRAASTVRRCHSTWCEFFKFLMSEDQVDGSPMPGIPRPKAPARVPKGFSLEDQGRIIRAVMDQAVARRDPWPELDAAAAMILLLTAVRLAELIGSNIGDVTPTAGNEKIRVLGKGDKDRVVPLERLGVEILEDYLRSRAARFPDQVRPQAQRADAPIWEWFHPKAPLFVDRTGNRMSRDALQYMMKKIYVTAGVEASRAKGALVHATRHTTATRLAENGMTGIELMLMLGHASMQNVQIYLHATGAAIRQAVGRNPAYEMLAAGREQDRTVSAGAEEEA